MRSIGCVLLALCLSVEMAEGAEQPKFSSAQQEVLNATKAKRDAREKRDMAAWAKYVADDCVFSNDDGILETKAQLIDFYKKHPFEYDHATNYRDFVVRLHGNTAVINSLATGHEQFGDTDIISEMRATETWVKEKGSWVMIAAQWGLLPVNFRKPVAADTSAYKDFVGQYEARPGSRDTVTVKDGKLWSEDEGDEEEYLPLGADTFFVKDDLGTVTFSRDAKGQVIGYAYRRADGQEVHSKKVK